MFYGKNGTAPQTKRAVRKFAGFEEADKQKKLDQLLTYELAAIKQTATILDLKDIKDSKDDVAKAIIDFLMCPTGKTLEEVQKDAPPEEDDEELDDEEEEVEVKPKKGRGGAKDSAGRPKRATATRVWTNGNISLCLSHSSVLTVINFRLWQQR